MNPLNLQQFSFTSKTFSLIVLKQSDKLFIKKHKTPLKNLGDSNALDGQHDLFGLEAINNIFVSQLRLDILVSNGFCWRILNVTDDMTQPLFSMITLCKIQQAKAVFVAPCCTLLDFIYFGSVGYKKDLSNVDYFW